MKKLVFNDSRQIEVQNVVTDNSSPTAFAVSIVMTPSAFISPHERSSDGNNSKNCFFITIY